MRPSDSPILTPSLSPTSDKPDQKDNKWYNNPMTPLPPFQRLILTLQKSDDHPIQVHVVIGSVLAATAAIEYARTGHTHLFASNYSTYSTNTALVLSIFALIASLVDLIRTSSASSIPSGLAFSALYLFSFVRLQAGHSYGYEISLLASILLGI